MPYLLFILLSKYHNIISYHHFYSPIQYLYFLPAFKFFGGKARRAGPRIKEIEVNFNRNVKHDSEEFARQLKDQEKGMNELTVDEYQKNRERYIAEGRAIEGNVAQQTAREEAFSDKVAELMSNGKSFDEAEKEAKEWLNTQAAIHNPNQIAGGKPDQVDGMGHKGINSSIGSQWRYRIDVVDEQIREMAKNMTPEQLKNTFLNVKLTH